MKGGLALAEGMRMNQQSRLINLTAMYYCLIRFLLCSIVN